MKKKLLAGLMAASLSIGSLMWSPTVEAEVQEYEGVGEYVMSNFETPDIAQKRAQAYAERNAQEQAGFFLQSKSKLENFKLTQDEITTITASVIKVLDVNMQVVPIDTKTIKYIATVRVNIDSDEIDKWLEHDARERKTLVEQSKALQKSNVEKDKEIEQLKQQISGIKTEADQKRLSALFETANKEFLSNQKVEEGNKFHYERKFNEAIEAYTEAIELNPKNVTAYFKRSNAYSALDQMEQELKDLNKAIDLDPNFADAYSIRGAVYSLLGQYDQAITNYTKAIELNPYSLVDYYFRSDAYEELGQYDQAISDYTKAIKLIEIAPNDSALYEYNNLEGMYQRRAWAYERLRQYDRMIVDYTKLIELNPNSFTYYAFRGNAYVALKKYERAVADYSKAIEFDPKYAWVYNNRGEAYNSLGQYNKAIADYNKAIEIDPKNANAYNNRALAYKALGNKERADADFAKAHELRSGSK